VGIGTTAPDSTAQLHTSTSSVTARNIIESTSASGYSGTRLKNATGYWETQIDGANQGLRWLDDGTERMRITSNGDVGIGTTSPSYTVVGRKVLQIQGSDAMLNLSNGADDFYMFKGATGVGVEFVNTDNSYMRFSTNNTERVRIAADGSVGIGVTSPDGTLHINTASAGTITANTSADDLVVENSVNSGISILSPDANYSLLYFGSPSDNDGMALGWNYSSGAGSFATKKVGSTLTFKADNLVTNLTLSGASGSELAEFEGNVTLSEGKLSITDTANENAFSVVSSATTTNAAEITANSLTTGQALRVYSNSANTSTRYLANIVNDNALATGATALRIQQDANQTVINAAGDGVTTADAFRFIADNATSAVITRIRGDSLTTGTVLQVSSNSADTNTRNLVEIVNDSTSATGATALKIQQDSQSPALHVDYTNSLGVAQSITTSTTTGNALRITADSLTAGNALYLRSNSVTSGKLAYFYSNSANTSSRNLVEIVNDNAAATGTTVLNIRNDSTGKAIDATGDVVISNGDLTLDGDLTFSSANPAIIGADVDGGLYITGGSATNAGAGVVFYGESHATVANDIRFRNGATIVGEYDSSATLWNFRSNNIKTTGSAGIGDAANTYKFEVHSGSTNITSNFVSTDAGAYILTTDSTGYAQIGNNGGTLELRPNGTNVVNITSTGLGIGTTPTQKLDVAGNANITGTLTATSKSFDIPHPSKEGMRLRYGSLEGPENGVYVRGKSTEEVIELPDYWVDLVHEDSITVQLTPIGGMQELYVKEIKDNKVYVAGSNYFYYVQAERKDIEKLEVEYTE